MSYNGYTPTYAAPSTSTSRHDSNAGAFQKLADFARQKTKNLKKKFNRQMSKEEKELKKLKQTMDPYFYGSSPEATALVDNHQPADIATAGMPPENKKRKFPSDDVSRYIALDCEMVGVGMRGKDSALGRVSVVDYNGEIVLDTYCRPNLCVTDYRTKYSGIRACHLKSAPSFAAVKYKINEITRDRILVGHAIANDLKALKITDLPKERIRDTSFSVRLREMAGFPKDQIASLKKLNKKLFNSDIQTGNTGHCSVEDAKATMRLFRLLIESQQQNSSGPPPAKKQCLNGEKPVYNSEKPVNYSEKPVINGKKTFYKTWFTIEKPVINSEKPDSYVPKPVSNGQSSSNGEINLTDEIPGSSGNPIVVTSGTNTEEDSNMEGESVTDKKSKKKKSKKSKKYKKSKNANTEGSCVL